MTESSELLKKIHSLIEELARLSQEKGSLTHPEVLEKSRELDKLIAQYYKTR